MNTHEKQLQYLYAEHMQLDEQITRIGAIVQNPTYCAFMSEVDVENYLNDIETHVNAIKELSEKTARILRKVREVKDEQ